MDLKLLTGESKSFAIPLYRDGSPLTPGSGDNLIFTAKRHRDDLDSAAVFQKFLGAGIAISGSTATVTTVYEDTDTEASSVLEWDIRHQYESTGAGAIVAQGSIYLTRAVTRENETSVPVYTTNPPAPGGTNAITSATTSDGTAALYLDSIRFETTNGGPTQTGQMAWESTDGSIDAMLESGVIVAMGEDLLIRVRNATASPIAKGAALAYDGTQGASGRLEVKPWVGSNISTAKLFLGFAAAAIPANSNGYAQWFGKLDGINTSGGGENWQDEQLIYAVPGTSSTLTNVAPTSGEYAAAAVVINAGSGTSGILYVRPTFEKFPVSADITDATSDGQTNPGKVLKTDSNGALQIETLTLGNDDPGTAGELSIVGSDNTATIRNDDDTTVTLKFGGTSGAIMVGAANLSEISSASTALTNLGVTGTGVQSALAAATNATGGLVTFGGNIGAATGTSLKIPTIICDSGLLEIKDSTTWQNLRIFSTTDNGSNFEYFTIAQSGAAWKISGVRSGTGPARQLQIQPSGTLQLGANGGDGWTINASKHLYPDGTTQSRDLGLVGNRIRTLYGQNADLTGNLTASGTVSAADLALTEKSADPADPAEGKSVIWQSDGTGSGDDGDIMIKITAGGATKTGTIIDFSTL